MNTKFSTLKQSPLFYLALIPVVTLGVLAAWQLGSGKSYLYVYYDDPIQSQLALALGSMVWLLILGFSLQIKITTSKKTLENHSIIYRLLSLVGAGAMAVVMFLCLNGLSNFTGVVFAFLCLTFVAVIMLTIQYNRWFYTTFGILTLFFPIVYLFEEPYRFSRFKDIILGGLDIELYYYPVAENLNSSVLLGSANANWYDVPAYYGQMTVLKLIYNVGYVPALLLVMVVFSAWVFAASKIYHAQNVNRFWQQLAYYLALFFIVEAVINVFGNLNIIESVMTTNLMPFSSNGALWVLFIAFVFACWKMQKPQQR